MQQRCNIVCALLLATVSCGAYAGEGGEVYTQLSTNGIGVGYGAPINADWALRGQFNFLPKNEFNGYVRDFGSDADLSLELGWNSLQLLADWYPGDSGFHWTGGVVLNNNKIVLKGTGQVNGKTATVYSETKMNPDGISPYFGMGYSVHPKASQGWGVSYDLGVMLQNPKSTLSASGGGVTQSDIDIQNSKVQDTFGRLKIMLMLGITLRYGF